MSVACYSTYLSGRVFFNNRCVIMLCLPAKKIMRVYRGAGIAVIFNLALNGTKFVLKHSRMTMIAANMTAFYCALVN